VAACPATKKTLAFGQIGGGRECVPIPHVSDEAGLWHLLLDAGTTGLRGLVHGATLLVHEVGERAGRLVITLVSWILTFEVWLMGRARYWNLSRWWGRMQG
jgi:hypothetical protein